MQDQNSALVLGCTWLTRLAWLNLVWLSLSLLGGVVFGIMPATVVVTQLIIKYLNKDKPLTIKCILVLYKQEFIRSNLSGWAVLLPTLSMGWYVKFAINSLSSGASMLALAMMPLVLIGVVLTFTTCVQKGLYNTNVKGDILNGFQLMIFNKKATLLSLLVGVVVVFISQFIPMFTLLFSISPILLTLVACKWWETEELHKREESLNE